MLICGCTEIQATNYFYEIVHNVKSPSRPADPGRSC